MQQQFIDYAMKFANLKKIHIYLGGSCLNKSATKYSDIDIAILCDDESVLRDFIYGYGQPIYISHTTNPKGILIIIYSNGIAVDLEIVKEINLIQKEWFHNVDIKTLNYTRNEEIYSELISNNDKIYQTSRLFHRSLIKYLSKKTDAGISVANEIADYMNIGYCVNKQNFKMQISALLDKFKSLYPISKEYTDNLNNLINDIET